MPDLYLHDQKLESVFELLGVHENATTYSIGWALSQSPSFLRAFLQRVSGKGDALETTVVRLQEHQPGKGITDLEIVRPDLHLIVEAKRGWMLPTARQLRLYAKRLARSRAQEQRLVVLAECSSQYAKLNLPKAVGGFRVTYLSWKDVCALAEVRKGRQAEKRLLGELRTYLRRLVSMQNQDSNLVYVVALATGNPRSSRISWIDVVVKKNRYFHPFGRNWPQEPPNYLGFRYGGKLQRIHHVEAAEIAENLHDAIPEIERRGWWGPFVVYKLGKPIIPTREVRTGKLFRSGRVWAALDLLLTCKTISQARDLTDKRMAGEW